MAQIEVGFRTVIGNEDLAMFDRAHGARIDVEIGVELAYSHAIAARLQQGAQRRRGQTFAQRRYNAACNENEPSRHGSILYPI
jgi:hypothetical protein